MSFARPKLLSDKELNIIRGKALVGHASVEEIASIFGHLDMIEMKLDEESGDCFGTEGWRHGFGIPGSD